MTFSRVLVVAALVAFAGAWLGAIGVDAIHNVLAWVTAGAALWCASEVVSA